MTIGSSDAGTAGLTLAGEAGLPFRMRSNTMPAVWPGKAGRPVSISYSVAPNEKRSDRWSSSSPRTCSGDM
jgi:hypothetical protein